MARDHVTAPPWIGSQQGYAMGRSSGIQFGAREGSRSPALDGRLAFLGFVPSLFAAMVLALSGLLWVPGTAAAGSITNARVTLATAVAGSTTTATITFVPQSAIPSGGKILVTFPSGSSAYTVAPTTATPTGFNTGTTLAIESITQTTVTIGATTTSAADTYTPGAGKVLTITLDGITLPASATTGTIGVLDALSTKAANGSALDTISGSLSFPQLVSGAMTNTSVTLSSNAKGATGDVTLGFTIANPLPAGGSIIITLPTGYAGSGATGVQAITPATSLCAPSCTASLTGQTITVVIGSNTIAKGTSVSLKLTNITNPATATAGAAFTIRTTTAASTGVPAYDVDTGQVTGPTITNSSLSGAQVSLGATQAGATTTATVSFTTDDAWPSDAKASITFPGGFCATSSASATVKVGTDTAVASPAVAVSPPTCLTSGVTFTVDRPAGSLIAAGGTKVVLVITGVVNPTTTGLITYGAGALKTVAANGSTVIATAPTVTSIQSSITGGSLTGGAVTASPNTAGATAAVSVPFLVTNPVPGGGSIQIAFPGDAGNVQGVGAYVLFASPWLASLTSVAYSMPASGAACTTTIPSGATTVSGATGATGTPTSTIPYLVTLPPSTTIPAGACVVVTVGSIRLPQVSGRSANFTITTRAAGSGSATGTLIDTGIATGAATVSPGALTGATISFASQTSAPDNDAGKPVKVTVGFTISPTNPLPVGGRVTVTFPTSPAPFTFGSVAVDSVNATINGTTSLVPGLFTVSNLYTAPDLDLNFEGSSPLSAGTAVSITLTDVTNPAISSVTSAQPSGTATQWTITTRTPPTFGSLPIDQATANGPIIIPALAGGPGATPTGAATGLGSPMIDVATGQAGVTESATVRLKLVNPLPAGSTIRVALPTDGFDASGAAIQGGAAVVTASTGATSTGAFTVSIATARTIAITYTGQTSFNDSSTLPAGATITLPITGIQLPSTVPATGQSAWGTTGTAGTTGTVLVQTETDTGFLLDRAATAKGITVMPAQASRVSWNVAPLIASVPATLSVTFTIGASADVPACVGPILNVADSISGRAGTCGTVTVTLPPSFTLPATLEASVAAISVGSGIPQAVVAVARNGSSITFATPVTLPSGSTVRIDVTSTAGIITPSAGGIYTSQIHTSSSPGDASSSGVTIGAPATAVTIKPVSPMIVGQRLGGLVISFMNGAGANLSATSGTITIGFPASFPIPTTIAPQFVVVNGTPLTSGSPPSITPRPGGGQVLTLRLPVSIGAGAPVDVAIWSAAGIDAPALVGPHSMTVQTSAVPVDVTGTVSFTADAAARLLVIFPGEIAAPGTTPGKSGTPTLTSGQASTVRILTVDRFSNKASSEASVTLAYADPLTVLPIDINGESRLNLVGGEASFSMTPSRSGTYAFSASDAAAMSALISSTQQLTVVAGPASRLLVILPGEAIAPGTASGIANPTRAISVASAPATVPITIVATDTLFNQAATPPGYSVTVSGGASTLTSNLVDGTTRVSMSLVAGTTTITVAGPGPITTTRAITVTIGTPSSGSSPEITEAPRSIRVSNVRDTTLTVTWVTDASTTGALRWGIDDGTAPNTDTYDRRGPAGSYSVHYVTLSGLTPSTRYRFDVISGSTTDTNNGSHYLATTGPTIGATSPDLAFGTASLSANGAATSAVVFVTASGPSGTSAPLAALITPSSRGYWAANLGNLRQASLDAPFPVTGDTVLTVTADAGTDGSVVSTTTVAAARAGTVALVLSSEASHPLQVGWNLVALRVTPKFATTASVACTSLNGATAGSAVELDRWIDGGWEGHRCGLPVNDFVLEPGAGYFIRVAHEATWIIAGSVVSTPLSLNLTTGWNLVGASAVAGVPSVASATCAQLNTAAAGTAVELDQWIDGGWDGHRCGLPVNDFTLEAGRGYFVRLLRPATWAPTGASPVSGASIRREDFSSPMPVAAPEP
jgi:hypothetical protein